MFEWVLVFVDFECFLDLFFDQLVEGLCLDLDCFWVEVCD